MYCYTMYLLIYVYDYDILYSNIGEYMIYVSDVAL